MSKHEHHNCECKHEDVRYCERCSLVYCVGCKVEWGRNYQWWPYTTTTWTGDDITKYNTTTDVVYNDGAAVCVHN